MEQPTEIGKEAEIEVLPADVNKIIACDESLNNASSIILLAVEPQTSDIFNIKLMKCGG